MSKSSAIAILLLSILIVGVFLVFPRCQDLRALRLEIGKRNAELQSKEKYFSNLQEASRELEKYQSELSKIDSALPSDPSLPSLFNFLQKASSQNGLILEDIGVFSVTVSEENPEIKEINLNLGASGSYSSFKNFLSTLEKSARLIEIENISFSAPEEKESSFSFDLKIKVRSY